MCFLSLKLSHTSFNSSNDSTTIESGDANEIVPITSGCFLLPTKIVL